MKKLDLFSTPLLILPEALSSAVCEPLREQILARAAVEPGVQRSNAGGAWHSDHDLLSRPETSLLGSLLARHARHALQELAGRVGHTPPTLAGVQLHAWATVLPDRAWIMPHDHGDAHLSGVLHLDEGDGTHGNLCLLAPRASLLPWAQLDPTAFEIRPQTGQLVWFPAGIQHWVTPNKGPARVSLAINVRFNLQASPKEAA